MCFMLLLCLLVWSSEWIFLIGSSGSGRYGVCDFVFGSLMILGLVFRILNGVIGVGQIGSSWTAYELDSCDIDNLLL